jgi:predicted PurR-regulated permease PerM
MEITMIVGYDYPILGFFWSVLILFLWIAWILLVFRIIADIFTNKRMGGVAKAFWLIFVVIVPFLGVFIYICVHGGSMAQNEMEAAQRQQASFDEYVRQTAGSSSSADELAKLAKLKEQGVITDAEFAAQKAKLLS